MKRVWFIVTVLLFGCPLRKQPKTAVIQQDNYEQSWQGSTKLQPANFTYVTSPCEGYITSFGLGFGRKVNVGDPLLEISAPKIKEDFIEAVIDYLRNKDKYFHQHKKLKGEKQLLDAGILSEEDYWGQTSTSQDAFISYMKSEIHLKEMAKLVGVEFSQLTKLKLEKQEELTNLLSKKISIHVIAQTSGLLLPSGLVEGSKQKSLDLGIKVEKGEILAAIAKQGKFKTNIMVPENLGRLISKKSQVTVTYALGGSVPAKITDFHPYMLKEKSGSRVFPVNIEIIAPKPPMLVPDLYVGMPVRVKLNIDKKQTFKVPVAAIRYDNHKYFVDQLQDSKQSEQTVDIVATDANFAYVKGQLQAGALVILHD